jgi:hypothetical protein
MDLIILCKKRKKKNPCRYLPINCNELSIVCNFKLYAIYVQHECENLNFSIASPEKRASRENINLSINEFESVSFPNECICTTDQCLF